MKRVSFSLMKTHTTNYFNTLILPAEDCPVAFSEAPPVKNVPSVASLQLDLIYENPYRFSSDDVLFTIFADRNQIPESERQEARTDFFSKGQACMRASALTKRYGWAIHSDKNGKIALIDTASEEYAKLSKDNAVEKVRAMRSKKG